MADALQHSAASGRVVSGQWTRRAWLAATLASLAARPGWTRQPPQPDIPLGFSLYGMRSWQIPAALKLCGEIGYETVELPLMADWPLDAARASEAQLDEVRGALHHHRLRLAGCMEHLVLTGDDEQHRRTLDRWRVSLRVAKTLAGEQPAIVETILGGKPAEWNELRERFRVRLADWEAVARQAGVTIAIKAHVGGAAHRPEHILWLLEQINSPWIRAAYDFSHFQLQGLTLKESLAALLPLTVFIHVKDTRGTREKFQFLLPGQGMPDVYPEMFELLRASSYRNGVVVEVSGQIHQRPDYDAEDAARRSWKALQGARSRGQ